MSILFAFFILSFWFYYFLVYFLFLTFTLYFLLSLRWWWRCRTRMFWALSCWCWLVRDSPSLCSIPSHRPNPTWSCWPVCRPRSAPGWRLWWDHIDCTVLKTLIILHSSVSWFVLLGPQWAALSLSPSVSEQSTDQQSHRDAPRKPCSVQPCPPPAGGRGLFTWRALI